jgi:transglutaminase-like putative cysteine protease
MYYAVTHLTTYVYSEAVTDSVMEVRLQPRTDLYQHCHTFNLEVSPDATVLMQRDYNDNVIHTFDIPAAHKQLAIKSEAIVEIMPQELPPETIPGSAWDELDALTDRDLYDMLLPGKYARETELLRAFAREIDWRRKTDPMTQLRELNTLIYEAFEYSQHVTKVDSQVDVALEQRRGVCQDFAHIMTALARRIGIPTRYVSGYLCHREDQSDRSDTDASHAWVETWLPGVEWVGFDPTNNLMVADRHIRICVGTDYADSSPTRGVFKGTAETKLEVKVQVSRLNALPRPDVVVAPEIILPHYELEHQQQQQQQ